MRGTSDGRATADGDIELLTGNLTRKRRWLVREKTAGRGPMRDTEQIELCGALL